MAIPGSGVVVAEVSAQIEIRPGRQSEADVRVSVDRGQLASVALVIVLLLVGVGALLRMWMRSGSEQASESAPRPPGGVLRLVDSPIQVMRWWAGGPRRFGSAVLPVILNAVALGGIALSTTSDAVAEATVDTLVVVLAVAGALTVFALHAAAVVLVDLLAVQSGRARRLVELSALAYWSQTTWSVPVLTILLAVGGEADLRAAIAVTEQLWIVWLIGLHATVLHVVSGLTVTGTVAAAVFMFVVFFGVPLLTTAIAPRIFF